MFLIESQTAGSMETKLDTQIPLHPGNVLVKVKVKVKVEVRAPQA